MDQVSLEQQEQILKSNRDLIINRLEADDVIDELIQKDVIGPHAAERLQLANATRTDKNRIIFDQLSTCGPDGLGEFCDILRRKKRQLFIAQQLEKSIHAAIGNEPVPKKMKCSALDVSKLKTRYTKMLPTSKTDWPKHTVTKYVRLVLVENKTVALGGEDLNEFTKLTLQGDVDKILKIKQPLDNLRDIFHYKNKPCPRLILIMGRPGIGKTTLANEICIQWAKDDFLVEDFDAVILIPLRSVQEISFEKVIEHYAGEENYQELKKSAGSRCLIILEGFDEISNAYRRSDQFLKHLIEECTVLEKATIIITSRPHACEEINAGRNLEVVGFGENEIKEFVQKSFPQDSQSVKEFLSQLDEYPQLHSICYIPMNLVMIVDIFRYSANKLPSTLTELYQLFIVMTLQRQVKKNTTETQLCSNLVMSACTIKNAENNLCVMLKGIPKETVTIVLCLSRLAYKGFFEWYCEGSKKCKNSKIIFTELDLLNCGIKVTNDFDGFGLLKGTLTHQLPIDINTYCFNHLTIQEFFCAVYISLLTQEEQVDLIKEQFGEYPNVFIFFCGLTELTCNETFQLIYSKLTSGYVYRGIPDIITALRCLNESKCKQSERDCPRAHQSVSPFTLNISGETLLPYDCVCLSKVLSCYPVSQLIMGGCRIGNKGAELLVKHYPNKNITDQLLEQLYLGYNEITSDGMVHVMKIVSTSSVTLRVLDVGDNNYGDNGMEVISKALRHNQSLTELYIYNCMIGVKGAVHISELLKVTHTLQVLSMWGNSVGDDGIAMISEALQHVKSLHRLAVSECGLSVKGAISVSKIMKLNHSLQELYIGENNIGDNGISAIAEAVNNCELKILNIQKCGITLTGARSVAAALLSNCTIKELDLHYNPITTEGALLIVKSAIENTVCQRVLISDKCKNNEVKTLIAALEKRDVLEPKGD